MPAPIRFVVFAALCSLALSTFAAPSSTGQTGLIHMPDGRVEPDGTWRLGASDNDPYSTFYTSVTVLPGFEFSGRYTVIRGLPSGLGGDFGDFKDKAFDTKLVVLGESRYLPSIAVGAQDILGTRLFDARYIAASKRMGDFDLTVGYGEGRIDGTFGGFRYRPSWAGNWGFVAEYDANDYASDLRAVESGVASRDGGLTLGVEYQWGWLGGQLAHQGDDTFINLHASIPLMRPTFIPNLHEPEPDTEEVRRVQIRDWRADERFAVELVRRLEEQGFRDVRIRLVGKRLEASLTHPRIHLVGRAVGRAARTLLLRGPADIESIRIVYTELEQPLLTYTFTDPDKLAEYLAGRLTRNQLVRYIEVLPADPADAVRFHGDPKYQVELERERHADLELVRGQGGHALMLRREAIGETQTQVIPLKFGFFFNDPSGAFRYDVFALGQYRRRLRHGMYLTAEARLTLLEDVSDVTQPSNSLLPHVRSDVADYKQAGPLKLNKLLINQYVHPAERTYGRLSVGIYEEMFAGAGGQILYLPKRGNWAVDLSVDWLQQRDTDGGLGFRDYNTVTALAAFHYRVPRLGLTGTVRAGRFLAKDEGWRWEIKRRYRSGVEFGAWYTYTNGRDTTNPGSPNDPYQDKGLFVSIPLHIMVTRDTRARAEFSLAPWTRDVGQMVTSPGDLYRIVERPLMLDDADHDPLSGFRR